jgi:hypothetical protein
MSTLTSPIFHTDGEHINSKQILLDLAKLFSPSNAVHSVSLHSLGKPPIKVTKLPEQELIEVTELITIENYLQKKEVVRDLLQYCGMNVDEIITAETLEKKPSGILICFTGNQHFNGQVGEGYLPLYFDDKDVQLVFADADGQTLLTIN